MKIALIRHTAPLIARGICYGRLDVALDPAGESTIHGIAADPALHGMTCVWTSPAQRCRHMAEAIGLALSARLIVDPRLQELDFGEWEGQPWDAITRADLDRWAASPLDFAPPGGESGSTLILRVRDVWQQLHRHQRDCIVVSHGGPLKVLRALLEGKPVDLLAAAPPMGSIRLLTCAPIQLPK